jgi:hypothetical protein
MMVSVLALRFFLYDTRQVLICVAFFGVFVYSYFHFHFFWFWKVRFLYLYVLSLFINIYIDIRTYMRINRNTCIFLQT